MHSQKNLKVLYFFTETTLEESVNFNGDGYVELNASLLPHDTMDEVIDVKFTTSASTGLLFWQGQSDNTDEFNDDFIALASKSYLIILNVNLLYL